MNSAYNVGPPQFRIIYEEFQRGQILFQNHEPEQFPWADLCSNSCSEIFLKHPRYVQVIFVSISFCFHASTNLISNLLFTQVDIVSSTPEDQRAWYQCFISTNIYCHNLIHPLNGFIDVQQVWLG